MLIAHAAVRPLVRGAASRGAVQARSMHLLPLSRTIGRSTLVTRVQYILHRAFSSITQSFSVPKSTPHLSRMIPRSSIQSSLSLPARFALARPSGGTPFLPRPVALPRTMMQVGFGTARTFATTRPIFANLVENVPVAARSLIEADFSFKSPPAQRLRTSFKKNKSSAMTTKNTAKLFSPGPKPMPIAERLDIEGLGQFFTAPPQVTVISYLDIPLAPTPTGRVPLAEQPLAGPSLIPSTTLAEIYGSHSKRGIRVASLFRRLDAANVWNNGATIKAFGDSSGLCTVLRVNFLGWTQRMVKNIIGEAGEGWCSLVETHPPVISSWASDNTSSSDGYLSSRSLSPLPSADSLLSSMRSDPTESFVMPTIDFSASFTSLQSSAVVPANMNSDESRPPSRISNFDNSCSARSDLADICPLAWSELRGPVQETSCSLRSVISFSSDHWRRVGTVVDNS